MNPRRLLILILGLSLSPLMLGCQTTNSLTIAQKPRASSVSLCHSLHDARSRFRARCYAYENWGELKHQTSLQTIQPTTTVGRN